MKKIKQIDTYYCDYCGKECEHTPQYVFPSLEETTVDACSPRDGNVLKRIIYASPHAKQKDICPKCQDQIAKLINLLHYADFIGDDMEKMIYELLKNTKV